MHDEALANQADAGLGNARAKPRNSSAGGSASTSSTPTAWSTMTHTARAARPSWCGPATTPRSTTTAATSWRSPLHVKQRRHLRSRLMRLQEGLCVYCRRPMRSLDYRTPEGERQPDDLPTLDHIHPRSLGGMGGRTSSCAAGDATTRNSTCPPTSSSRAYRPPQVPHGRADVIPRPDETAAHFPAGQAWLAHCVFQLGRRPHRRNCPPSLSGQDITNRQPLRPHRVRDGLQDVRQVLDDVASEI